MNATRQETIDQEALRMRREFFENVRMSTIINQFQKHFTGKCNCKKTGKTCQYDGKPLDPKRMNEPQYIIENMTTIQTFYNSCQSITQSYRCVSGKSWEEIVSSLLTKNNIPHSKQWYVNMKTHTFSKKRKRGSHSVDIVVPIPHEGDSISDFELISCKTKLRERFLQDKFLRCRYTLVSLESLDEDDVNSICVAEDTTQLQDWMNRLADFYN